MPKNFGEILQRMLVQNMLGQQDAPQIYSEQYEDPEFNRRGTRLYGRLPIEQFGGLVPEQQEQYIKHMQQAPNAAFAKLWPETVRSPHGQGLSKEIIDSLLQQYLDVQRTGLPQGY